MPTEHDDLTCGKQGSIVLDHAGHPNLPISLLICHVFALLQMAWDFSPLPAMPISDTTVFLLLRTSIF